MNFAGMRGYSALRKDDEILRHELKPGTVRRVLRFGRPYAGILAFFLVLVVLDAAVGVVNPLIYRHLINGGILAGKAGVVIRLALLAAGVSLVDSSLTFAQRQLATRIGLDIVLDLRTRVFAHVQQMSVAFFTRTRTGALVSRLNTDVSGVQDAFTDLLSTAVGNLVSVILVLGVMFALSWQLTCAALVVVPFFLWAARQVGRKVSALTREAYDRAAEMNNLMIERFNVAGAVVCKIFGRPEEERATFAQHAKRVRDIRLRLSTYARVLYLGLGLMAALAVAAVYGWGGVEAARRALDVGTVVALVSYLLRLYGPLTALSSLQVDVMTTLVSFDRVFEVLDLQPSVREKPKARMLPPGPVRLEFNGVGFRYPTAAEISLASLESVAVLERHPERDVLHDISFTAEPGEMIALVGPSGAGKTTLALLAARLYDPRQGAVGINGMDLRDATLASVRDTVGVVMQDAHLFHDTIRANLRYAKPDATEAQLREALQAAQLLPLVDSLPKGLDTMLGERGHRMSGGEKQRLAIARLLLKAPRLVILDEATAHLDSHSEAAIQQAFTTALAGRTSLVIAHRLSTVQSANQILVVDRGRVVERGRHDDLVRAGGLYARLHATQFATAAKPLERGGRS
ncbi:MAG TPA: ABC transporter ATP-binding protein [Opitutaceae bacterium]|nr:ABC transporter ATP-binding protein [Opitutaceae bacterium]